MKIAQIVCTFPPYNGGMGNSVKNLSKILIKDGVDVTVFTPVFNKENFQDGELKVERLESYFKFGNATLLLQLIWILKKFDVIHLHLPFLGATLPIWIFSILNRKKKIIVTYHMDLIAMDGRRFFFIFYNKIILPIILRRADKIIVSSLDYAKHSNIAKMLKKKKDKIYEIPFSVDVARFYPALKNQDLLKKYFIEDEETVIGFVGGLDGAHYFKGVDILLRAFKEIVVEERIKNLKLLIVGDGDKKKDYLDMANGLGIRDLTIFAGNVSDDNLPAYYNLMDIFVLPSVTRSEAFGIALLEAGSCAKPLLASNLPGVRTLIIEGENGFLVKPGNYSDLAEKIKKIILDKEKLKLMGDNSLRIVKEKYIESKIIFDIKKIYA